VDCSEAPRVALTGSVHHVGKTSTQVKVGQVRPTNTNRAEMVENAVEYIRELHKKFDVETRTEKEAVELNLNNMKDRLHSCERPQALAGSSFTSI
jgi:hypothetical protein